MKYYTDGFTLRNNPSPIGGGYTIIDENNTLLKVENIKKVGMTNNEAELRGLHECLKLTKKDDCISTDSMNTISWIRTKKDKKIARQDLVEIIRECRSYMVEKNINIIWEGRDFNLAGIYNEENGLDTVKQDILERNRQQSFLKSL